MATGLPHNDELPSAHRPILGPDGQQIYYRQYDVPELFGISDMVADARERFANGKDRVVALTHSALVGVQQGWQRRPLARVALRNGGALLPPRLEDEPHDDGQADALIDRTEDEPVISATDRVTEKAVWREHDPEEQALLEAEAEKEVTYWMNRWSAASSGRHVTPNITLGTVTGSMSSSSLRIRQPAQRAQWHELSAAEQRACTRQSYRDGFEWMKPFFAATINDLSFDQMMAYETACRRAESPSFDGLWALGQGVKRFLGGLAMGLRNIETKRPTEEEMQMELGRLYREMYPVLRSQQYAELMAKASRHGEAVGNTEISLEEAASFWRAGDELDVWPVGVSDSAIRKLIYGAMVARVRTMARDEPQKRLEQFAARLVAD